MHRLIAITILLFWAIMFGGLAHLSLSEQLHSTAQGASELQLLFSTVSNFKVMPVLLIVVAALFGWAILALVMSDYDAFREVEVHSYAAAIFLMCASAVLAFANLSLVMTAPAVLAAALVTSVAASRYLSVEITPETAIDHGREIARRMALGAAHNSLLSRVSGRPLPGQVLPKQNVMHFPTKPFNGANI